MYTHLFLLELLFYIYLVSYKFYIVELFSHCNKLLRLLCLSLAYHNYKVEAMGYKLVWILLLFSDFRWVSLFTSLVNKLYISALLLKYSFICCYLNSEIVLIKITPCISHTDHISQNVFSYFDPGTQIFLCTWYKSLCISWKIMNISISSTSMMLSVKKVKIFTLLKNIMQFWGSFSINKTKILVKK